MPETTTPKPQTARHFEIGARIMHNEHGTGSIVESEGGYRYPKFDSGATGTAYTRVWLAPAAVER
jgi:hypothetical protein